MFYTKFELTQANFLLAQLQMHSLWRAGECLAISFPHQDWGRSYIFFPDMYEWTSGPIFSGKVRFFSDIDRGTSGGDSENYAEPTTHVFRCF